MEWGINLKGHEFDLADWAEMLQLPFDPHVEVIKRDGKDLFVLFTKAFQDFSDASEIHEAAVPLLRRLNALVAIERNGDPVEEDGIVQRDADGTIRFHYRLVADTIRVRTRISAVVISVQNASGDLNEYPPRPSFAQAALNDASPNLNEALENFSRADNWHDLYKVVEAICHECGGEHRVGERFRERFGLLPQDANDIQQNIKDIKATAQLTRHHRTTARAKRKWEFTDAKMYAKHLLGKLLNRT